MEDGCVKAPFSLYGKYGEKHHLSLIYDERMKREDA